MSIEKTRPDYISTMRFSIETSSKWRTNSPTNPLLQLISNIQVAANFKEKAKVPLFFKGSVNNGHDVRASMWFGRERDYQKDLFSLRTDHSIFTSIAPEIFDHSDESMQYFPSSKSTRCFLPQSIVSDRSDLSSETNSSCSLT